MIATHTPDFEGIEWTFDDFARELTDLACVEEIDELKVELPALVRPDLASDDEIWRAAADLDLLPI